MAENEMQAEIVFEDNTMMAVRSTVKEITSEIEGKKNLALPLIPVADEDGAKVWINANHIRMIRAAGGLD